MSEHTSPTIWQKIQAVMADVTHIEKGGWNDYHNYAYATDEDVLDAVHKALVSHGLVFLPGMVEVIQDENKTLARFEFQIVDAETGDCITLPWHGEANDTQDKGVSKAATAAVKYFWLKTLLIPTGQKEDDPDAKSPATQSTRKRSSKAPRNDGNPADFTLPFGKFKGQTVAAIFADAENEGASYLQWLTSDAFEAKNDAGRRAKVAAAAYLASQLEPAPELAHWIDDTKVRNRFWAWTGGLGLDSQEVHDALDVISVKDFGGTMAEAKSLIETFVEQRDAAVEEPF